VNKEYTNNLTFRIIIFLSLFTLFLSNNLSGDYFYFTCYALILTFGIIHGANDILILLKGKKATTKAVINKTLKYFFIVVLICLVFFNLPTISLLFFLLFSAYHFGEQQWTIFENNNSNTLTLFYFFFGSLIFTMLFTINSSEVSDVIFDITKFYIPKSAYGISLLILLVINVVFMLINYRILKAQLVHQFILFSVMSIVFSFFDLLPAFAVYFVYFHSIPSIIEQAEFLFEDSSVKSFRKFIIKGFIYWLIAIIFLAFLYMIVKDKIDFSLGIFFSFLAAITFPHVLVIYKMKEITRKN
tara:strand:+ start:1237 stop:2136 length:900 start_codon:yes stop_codon:yes gene_type:complete